MIANGAKRYTVQSVADILGLYKGTVVNYEKRGIFPEPRRNPINGYREYTEEDIERLKTIIEGKSQQNKKKWEG
ncbi:MAG: MerR family transcriptional regulator [Candidatus Omnitrophota bacterium]